MGGQIAINAAKAKERLARSICRLVQTHKFGDFWHECDDDERNRIMHLIYTQSFEEINTMMREKRRRELSGYSVLELRRMARRLGVSDAHIQPKYMLVFLVTQGLEADERSGDDCENRTDARSDEGALLESRHQQEQVQEVPDQNQESGPIGFGETVQFLYCCEPLLDGVQTDLGTTHGIGVETVADTFGHVSAGAEVPESGEERVA